MLRLCPRGVLWDPTSSPWSVIPWHRCRGAGCWSFPLGLLVGCFWGSQSPLFIAGVVALHKSSRASVVPGRAASFRLDWEKPFLGGKVMELSCCRS